MVSKITASPLLVRAVPFAVFLVLTFFQDQFGEVGRYWMYAAKTIAGAAMIWALRPFIEEMRWKFSWEAVAVGVGVFVMWVGIDSFYPKLDELSVKLGMSKAAEARAGWNPHAQFGHGAALGWFFIVVRILGSSLVVPPMEEVFFRSFIYRYLVKQEFITVPLGLFAWMPFLVTSLLFGLEHREWVAGILCGFAYQGLVCLKGRLGDAITAHAITNLLLGIWVVWRGAWGFW